MVPWAIIFVLQVVWTSSTSTADLRTRQHSTDDLQGELDYLRALGEPRQIFQGPFLEPDVIPSYLGLKASPQYLPPDHSVSDYKKEEVSLGHGKVQTPWGIGKGKTNSFALSSLQMKQPDLDAEAIAYSSVKDVESEGIVEESEGDVPKLSNQEEDMKSQSAEQIFTVSEAMARKSGGLTTAHQNSETVVADSFSDVYFVAIVAGCSAAGIFGVISAGFCFYKLQKNNKASADVDYPAYGVTGPNKDTTSPNGDRKLAQSAQMYHYQHQKQQMIAVEKAGSTKNASASDVDSEEENEEGDYTVYECPGLAPTGEMEVKNPLFNDDSTPMTPSVLPAKPESILSK